VSSWTDYPVERRHCGAKIDEIFEGNEQIQQLL
jgi:alkylation response protein AidB-like acyl-CoA dehydrogenase